MPLARQIIDLFGEMGVRVASGKLSGAWRLGAVQTAQIALLPGALKLLHEQHPRVSVRMHMVARGLGLALVPVTRPQFAPDNVRAVSLGEATFYREIGMVSHDDPERGGLVSVLRDCLRQTAGGLANAHPALNKPGEAKT